MPNQRPVVALTGASGYIGNNLMDKLTEHADIIALSRSGDNKEDSENVTWRSCDLYSMADAEKGLEGADIAVYLVHSMMPGAKLTQGSFQDMDVILADNFAQAAKKQGVKQIIYLSGIIPKSSKSLSRHLKSRQEVDEILRAYGVPVTTIRAGLIVGPKGSSFPILKKLVKRLPVMLLPKWTKTETHPVALPDVLNALDKSVGSEELKDRSIDVGGPEVMTYRSMMLKTAQVMGRDPKLFDLPFMTVRLSRLWVSLVAGAPKEIAYPLIESLTHPMTTHPENEVPGISRGSITFEEAARYALEQEQESQGKSTKKTPNLNIQHDVRSVQRIIVPAGKDANWVGQHYVKWLEDKLNPWIKTTVDEDLNCRIGFSFTESSLLKMSYSHERSTSNRALYYITGGGLSDNQKNIRGRMEFRQIPGTDEAIVAIHDFMPSLPWFFYKYTQAKIHLLVMAMFSKHLERLEDRSQEAVNRNFITE
ncbi:NAD(P)H-binding protein [Halobacillus sp. K22]|uniref:NAD(P)H-binding protein n=1 Tax=Halobacillus sp. K22 TaxID=3457431 RepID=UPI003FCDF996